MRNSVRKEAFFEVEKSFTEHIMWSKTFLAQKKVHMGFFYRKYYSFRRSSDLKAKVSKIAKKNNTPLRVAKRASDDETKKPRVPQ